MEVISIVGSLGAFASALVRISNTYELQENGQSDLSLTEQLLKWIESVHVSLGINPVDLQLASGLAKEMELQRGDGNGDGFFGAPAVFAESNKKVYLDFELLETLTETECEAVTASETISNPNPNPDHTPNRCGRVEIELDCKNTPITAYNFYCLCSGQRGLGFTTNCPLTYKGCAVHRVVADMCMQSGDIQGLGGYGGESIYGGEFNDENMNQSQSPLQSHDRAGCVSMGNSGPDTNTSQFFITLAPALHLDGNNCLFGVVTSGMEYIHAITGSNSSGLGSGLECDEDDVPLKKWVISDCGVVM